jgi:hypothetical protein
LFLQRVISKLQQAGWPFKVDTGWTTCDLGIPVDFWTRLTLNTASEELGQGKKNLRCRIRGFWSLPAKLLFWGVACGVVLLIASLAEAIPWLWMTLLFLPLLAWALDERREDYERTCVHMLDTVARELTMVKLDSTSASSKAPRQ